MFHKITSISPLPNQTLRITFQNHTTKFYDVKPLYQVWPIFRDLQDPALFQKVQVDPGGYGISWNDTLDLSCNELWENGQLQPL